ncbi:hypothetical protein FKM82_030956 [Ascaphus truei]
MDHPLLRHILHTLGIRNKVLSWISSYLSHRTFSVSSANTSSSSIDLCRGCLLSTPFVSKALSRLKPFSLTAPHLWNALPLSTRLAPSLSTFKTQLKTHLLKEAYE